MTVDFGFENFDAARQIVFLEVRGGGKDVGLGGIVFGQAKAT